MPGLLRWLNDKVVALVDPGKEERRDALATALYQSLARDKGQFELDRAQLALGIDSDDADHVIERVYRRVLATGWKDGQLEDAEKRTLHWVAQKLQIATETAREINLDYAKRAFEKALSKAMEDGYVDEDEAAALERIAAGMGSNVVALVAHCFASEGDSLLRGIFLAAAEDGAITAKEWSRLVQTAQRLGLSPQKLSATLAPHVEPFIEHVLADVKADGELTEAEDRTLSWLLEQLPVPARTERYVRQELAELRQIQRPASAGCRALRILEGSNFALARSCTSPEAPSITTSGVCKAVRGSTSMRAQSRSRTPDYYSHRRYGRSRSITGACCRSSGTRTRSRFERAPRAPAGTHSQNGLVWPTPST